MRGEKSYNSEAAEDATIIKSKSREQFTFPTQQEKKKRKQGSSKHIDSFSKPRQLCYCHCLFLFLFFVSLFSLFRVHHRLQLWKIRHDADYSAEREKKKNALLYVVQISCTTRSEQSYATSSAAFPRLFSSFYSFSPFFLCCKPDIEQSQKKKKENERREYYQYA